MHPEMRLPTLARVIQSLVARKAKHRNRTQLSVVRAQIFDPRGRDHLIRLGSLCLRRRGNTKR